MVGVVLWGLWLDGVSQGSADVVQEACLSHRSWETKRGRALGPSIPVKSFPLIQNFLSEVFASFSMTFR